MRYLQGPAIKNWCFHDKGGPPPAPVHSWHSHTNWETIFPDMLRASLSLPGEVCLHVCAFVSVQERERENLCPFIFKKMEGFFKGIILSIQLYAIEYKSVCTCHFSKKWSWRHQLELALWQRQILANVYMTVCLFCQSEAKQSNGIATVKFSLTRPDLKKTHNNRNSSVDSQN